MVIVTLVRHFDLFFCVSVHLIILTIYISYPSEAELSSSGKAKMTSLTAHVRLTGMEID